MRKRARCRLANHPIRGTVHISGEHCRNVPLFHHADCFKQVSREELSSHFFFFFFPRARFRCSSAVRKHHFFAECILCGEVFIRDGAPASTFAEVRRRVFPGFRFARGRAVARDVVLFQAVFATLLVRGRAPSQPLAADPALLTTNICTIPTRRR